MDGVASELNPGWVHRRMNTYPEVRYAQNVFVSFSNKQNIQNVMRMPSLVGVAYPSTGPPDPIRGYAIPGCACRRTNKALIDQ